MKARDAALGLLAGSSLAAAAAAEHALRRRLRRPGGRFRLSTLERAAVSAMPVFDIDKASGALLRYDSRFRRWMVSVTLDDAGRRTDIALSERDPMAFESAYAQALDVVLAGEPAFQADADEAERGASFVTLAGDRFKLWVACPDCGGHWLDLPVPPETAHRFDARRLGGAFLREQTSCLNCVAASIRGGGVPSNTQSAAWYDTVAGQWLLWQPLGGGTGFNVPLGLDNFFCSTDEVAQAAAAVLRGA